MHNGNHGSRRTFLKSVLAGSAVAAGAVSVGRTTGIVEGTAAGPGDHHHHEEVLHRDTEEFRHYYETLRDC